MTTRTHLPSLASSVLSLALAGSMLFGCAESDGAPASPPEATARATSLVGVEPAHYAVTRVDDGVLFVARIGATETVCGDRAAKRDCALASLDLSRLDLSPSDETLARARIADGTAVVKGKLGRGADAGESVLVATSLWVRHAAATTLAGKRPPTDALYVLRDLHEGCDANANANACAWLRAEPVAGGRATHLADIDLSLVGGALDGATSAAIARGEVLAYGAPIGARFYAASLFVPFGTTSSSTTPPTLR